jgi:hypothetical protein
VEPAPLSGPLSGHPYSSLLREGLASPPVTRLSRVGSYPTISPLPVRVGACALTRSGGSHERPDAYANGGVISVALSLESPRVGVTDFPVLWSPDFPPAGGNCPPAILRPPPTDGILAEIRRSPSFTSSAPQDRLGDSFVGLSAEPPDDEALYGFVPGSRVAFLSRGSCGTQGSHNIRGLLRHEKSGDRSGRPGTLELAVGVGASALAIHIACYYFMQCHGEVPLSAFGSAQSR